jgi:hypothetical protein
LKIFAHAAVPILALLQRDLECLIGGRSAIVGVIPMSQRFICGMDRHEWILYATMVLNTDGRTRNDSLPVVVKM